VLFRSILDKLTKKSDTAGAINVDPTKNIYGPYLRSGIPALPVCVNKGDSSLKIGTGTPAGGTGTEGWVYSTDTGEIIANCADTEKDESSVQYNDY